MKRTLVENCPALQPTIKEGKAICWTFQKKGLPSNGQRSDEFSTKLMDLLDLAKKSGYNEVTAKQVTIAYYGKYTTKDSNDRKTFEEIKDGLSKIPSPYNGVVVEN